MLNVLVNNFSVMLGRSHRFLGITSTFWGEICLAQGHNTATLDPESEVFIHQATAPPPRRWKGEASILFDFFNNSVGFWGASAPQTPSSPFIYSLYTAWQLFPFPPLCADFKHRHMDAYACIIFSHLHIKDFVIDIHVYYTYGIIP